jgi:hypothetical protein
VDCLKVLSQNSHGDVWESGYNMYRGWTQTDYQNKHYNINEKTKEHRTTEEEMEGPTSS